MKRKLDRIVRNWLEAEGRDDAGRAEEALGKVFRALPMPGPSTSLAARVLAELGLEAAAKQRPHWAYRWAVSVALGLSGLATVLYVPTLLSLGLRGGVNWVVEAGAGFLTAVLRGVAGSYRLVEAVSRAAGTAADVMATPQTLGLTLATVLFGLATFRVLAGLVALERSSYHG